MPLNQTMNTLVQCDFDGTVTERDVSFFLLDNFADSSWRQLLEEYKNSNMSVGTFNRLAFGMIKADKQTLLDFVLKSGKIKIRPGFRELVAYCSERSFEFAIVSNGLDFYIEAILADLGINNIEVFAARSRFNAEGLHTQYIGPDGSILEGCFKEAHTALFQKKGYRVIYVGNGVSDINPAKMCHHIFATGDLLEHCQKANLNCTPFDDLNEVVKGLELLRLG